MCSKKFSFIGAAARCDASKGCGLLTQKAKEEFEQDFFWYDFVYLHCWAFLLLLLLGPLPSFASFLALSGLLLVVAQLRAHRLSEGGVWASCASPGSEHRPSSCGALAWAAPRHGSLDQELKLHLPQLRYSCH